MAGSADLAGLASLSSLFADGPAEDEALRLLQDPADGAPHEGFLVLAALCGHEAPEPEPGFSGP
jgi:hypothetical protein